MATAALAITLWLAQGASAPPQGDLDAAVALYASAAYEEALTALDRLRSTASDDAAGRANIDRYRMLCLLALGRNAEAEAVIVTLLEHNPAYTLSETDAAPRIVRVFTDARLRALPAAIRRRYASAKALYNEGRFSEAAAEFSAVSDLLADPTLAEVPNLADLDLLARGFKELSLETVAAKTRREEAAAEAQRAAEALAEERRAAEAAAAAQPAPAPRDVYDATDVAVKPPVPLEQGIGRWFGIPAPRAGTPLGTVEVVVDEQGKVAASAMRVSLNKFYDSVLIEATTTWRYQPATLNGKPVRYRRTVALVSGG